MKDARPLSIIVERGYLRLPSEAGALLGPRVDLYRCGAVFALVPTSSGALKVETKAGSGKLVNIECAALCAYLRGLCKRQGPFRLPAWDHPGGMLLFGRDDGREYGTFEGFKVPAPMERYPLTCPEAPPAQSGNGRGCQVR